MNSSFIVAAVAATIFAIGAFLFSENFNSTSLAIYVFASSFISGAILVFKSNTNEDSQFTTLYVGNLPYRANEATVKDLFSPFGQVQSVRLMKDKQTGKRRGFGFVEIAIEGATKAIEALNDTEFQQRTIKVREAKEKP